MTARLRPPSHIERTSSGHPGIRIRPGDAGGWPALTWGKRMSEAGIPLGETICRLS
jgi:hypothetical protein